MYTFKRISDYLNTGQPFTCKVISYDRRRKSGGDVNEYEGVLVQRSGRGRTAVEQMKAELVELDSIDKRSPNHRHWHTRNIRLLANGHPTSTIKKIHLPLIVEFNGEAVVP